MSYRKYLMTSDISPSELFKAVEISTDLAEVGTDCISRQAALDIFDDYNVAVENGQIEAYSRDRKRLCDLPPAQPKRINGRWIPVGGALYQCDQCGAVSLERKFCSDCGADMRGER